MNYRKPVLALVGVILLVVLLSLWISWQAVIVLFILLAIVAGLAQANSQQTIKARAPEATPQTPEYKMPEYEQGYQAQMPTSSAEPKQDPPGGYYDQAQVHYPEPEQALPPMHESI